MPVPEDHFVIVGRRSGMTSTALIRAISETHRLGLLGFADVHTANAAAAYKEVASWSMTEIRVLNRLGEARHPKKKPKRRRRRNNPRPNRRRKAQKLRAAKQRPTWYQHLTDGDEEHVERGPQAP